MGIEDHGFDHDGIEDELNEAASDCALIDFDDEFPFDVDLANASHDRKNEFIFKLIQSCWQNPNIVFDLKMSKFNAGLFSIAMADIANAKELYSRQCPVIFNSGMHGDEAFFRTLAIGNNPYLNYLVDSYFRDRCKNEAEIETFFRITRGSIHELGISQLLLDGNNAKKEIISSKHKSIQTESIQVCKMVMHRIVYIGIRRNNCNNYCVLCVCVY